MEPIGFLIIGFAVGASVVLTYRYLFGSVIVYEFHNALYFRNGRYERTLDTGKHRFKRLETKIYLFDKRRQQLALPGQEVLTKDNVNIKISFAGFYTVTDPQKALNNSMTTSVAYGNYGTTTNSIAVEQPSNYYSDLYTAAQLAVREVTGEFTMDEILENRNAVGEKLLEALKQAAADIGIEVESMSVRDIMLPAGLKRAYAGVLEAQKDAQINLEKARGEQAILRKLANSAKLLEDNPALAQLRVLQALGEDSGNSIIFSSGGMPAITAHEANKKKATGGKGK